MLDPLAAGRILRRWGGAAALVAAVIAAGCSSADPNPEWQCAPTVDVTGVWDVSRVGDSGAGITCMDIENVWTLYQSGCNVTIHSEDWDPANGVTGTIDGNRLYVEWTSYEGCYRYRETFDVTVDGNTMTGTYYLARTQAVFPADCPGTGLCSAVVHGTRRTN